MLAPRLRSLTCALAVLVPVASLVVGPARSVAAGDPGGAAGGKAGAPGGGGPSVIVVPTGSGPGLLVSTRVAAAVAKRLRAKGTTARIAAVPPTMPGSGAAAAEAKSHYDAALKAFEKLDFDNVRKSAGAALKLYKRLAKTGRGGDGYVRTLHVRAAAALFDGDNAGAFKAINDAVIFRRLAPSRKRFNPTVQQLYAKVAAQSRDTHAGAIKVQVKPPALMWMNNRFIGVAEGTVRTRAGLYLIRLARPGHLAMLRWFRVRPDKTRPLVVALKPGVAGESGLTKLLRREAQSSPGSGVRAALSRFGGSEIVLVGAGGGCSATSCPVTLHRGSGVTWTSKSNVQYSGDAAKAAEDLLGGGSSAPAFGSCQTDAQCGPNERCVDNSCTRPSSLVRKWWFWTLIGVGAAGIAAAIAIPLSRPDGPVIEVR